jgi:hypothetical protein
MADPALNKMVAGFTSDGTPLSALIGNKMEWGVVTLLIPALITTTSFRNVLVTTKHIKLLL